MPPTRKYEADGGPGMRQVLDLLKGSDQAQTDQRLFLKAQIVFWLLGATDGHAKNFSVFLQPGGRFRLTPLYDVMSAEPATDAGQLRKNKMKLAMAVGENRHYVIDRITARHFLQTAARSGVPESAVQTIFNELLDAEENAIGQVLNNLPGDFPQQLAASIAGGLRTRLKLLERVATAKGRGVR